LVELGRRQAAIESKGLSLWYGDFQALFNVNLRIKQGRVTSLIGPSGCGKSTFLRTINRINERHSYVRTVGSVEVFGENVIGPEVELAQVRRQVGMVFQRPNALPLTIAKNVQFGFDLHNEAPLSKGERETLVEESLRRVLLWDQVKDRLGDVATSLSLEEQQKLCIARLLPMKPRVLLMDEPCSALDPKATAVIEDLIWELRGEYSILIVTHNMAQARRASDECVFMLLGEVIEHSKTEEMFLTPVHQKTADYIEGRYG